ncbi:hypothetical protein GGER_34980 [Serratia rubidaea]
MLPIGTAPNFVKKAFRLALRRRDKSAVAGWRGLATYQVVALLIIMLTTAGRGVATAECLIDVKLWRIKGDRNAIKKS